MKLGVETVPPVSLNTVRFFLTALLFLPFAKKISVADLKKLIPVSLFFMCGNLILAYLALDRITGNSFVVIVQVAQPVTILLAWILHKERFGIMTVLGILIAFCGLVITFGAPDIKASPSGAILTILAGASWALGSLAMKKTAHIKPATFLSYTYLMAFPVALIATTVMEQDQIARFMSAPPLTIGFVLFYQVILMSLMTFVWSGLMARHQAQYVTPFLMLQPIIAVIGGYYLLGETLNWYVAAGGIAVLAGIGIINWRRFIRAKEPLIS